MDATTTRLTFRWRARRLHVDLPPHAPMSDLRDRLREQTNVPPARQVLLLAGRRDRPRDDELVSAVFADALQDGRPVAMMGAPDGDEVGTAMSRAAATAAETSVVNDLDIAPMASSIESDVAATDAAASRWNVPTPPPVPPHWASQRAFTPSQRVPIPLPPPPPPLASATDSPAAIDTFVPAFDDSDSITDEDMSPMHSDATPTNGAALRLEEVDDMLADARCGAAFVDQHMQPDADDTLPHPMNVMPHDRFMKAVGQAKADLKMLAVLVVNCGANEGVCTNSFALLDDGADDENNQDEGSANGDNESTPSADPIALSTSFINETLRSGAVADVLNENFVVFAADVAPLPDSGASLLRRLGAHSLPLVLLLSDVGSGVALVDMFAADFYGSDASAAPAIAARLLDTLATYECFYETARVRRIASEAREDVIAEQDAEFQRAQAEDRARAQAEQEKKQREEEDAARAAAETQDALDSLPPEPASGGARIALRMPDGQRLQRKFENTHTIRDVLNWCVSLGVRKGTFRLSASFPKRAFGDADAALSLSDAGLVPSAALMVDLV